MSNPRQTCFCGNPAVFPQDRYAVEPLSRAFPFTISIQTCPASQVWNPTRRASVGVLLFGGKTEVRRDMALVIACGSCRCKPVLPCKFGTPLEGLLWPFCRFPQKQDCTEPLTQWQCGRPSGANLFCLAGLKPCWNGFCGRYAVLGQNGFAG